jgi:hypothetical protein
MARTHTCISPRRDRPGSSRRRDGLEGDVSIPELDWMMDKGEGLEGGWVGDQEILVHVLACVREEHLQATMEHMKVILMQRTHVDDVSVVMEMEISMRENSARSGGGGKEKDDEEPRSAPWRVSPNDIHASLNEGFDDDHREKSPRAPTPMNADDVSHRSYVDRRRRRPRPQPLRSA